MVQQVVAAETKSPALAVPVGINYWSLSRGAPGWSGEEEPREQEVGDCRVHVYARIFLHFPERLGAFPESLLTPCLGMTSPLCAVEGTSQHASFLMQAPVPCRQDWTLQRTFSSSHAAEAGPGAAQFDWCCSSFSFYSSSPSPLRHT